MVDTFLQGETVGRYELVTRLSIGGMAELFLARLAGPGGFQKLVALKMILPDVRQDERFVAMFLDEARLSAELSHPNLGQVFDLGQEKSGELYLAMEFISGQNVGALLRASRRASRRLPIEVTVRVIRDVCLGLHAAHSHCDPSGRPRQVIHRDIAPKNVMVTFDGHVKVIDFGIAHASGRRARTQTGVVKGTPPYMAPEQVAGEAPSPMTDVYAVGIMLYECLTGELPFRSDAPLARFTKPPPPPSEKNSDVTAALDAVCLKALEIEPGRRFQTAREFARALTDARTEVSDEEGLAALMAELFPGQRASLAKLAETARDPNLPSEQISKLAREVLSAEATPSHASPSAATPTAPPEAGRTQPELATVGWKKLTPRQLVAAGAGGAVAVLALVAGLFVLEPKGDDAPKPLSGAKAPKELLPSALRPAPQPSSSPTPGPTPMTSEELLAELKLAFSDGRLVDAESLLNRCRSAAPPCPRWPQWLEKLTKEQEFVRLLDDASAALDEGDIARAGPLLEKAGGFMTRGWAEGTTSSRKRLQALNERRRVAVSQRLLEEAKRAKKARQFILRRSLEDDPLAPSAPPPTNDLKYPW
jgi:serine/threonine protein kinase, bacterial